MHSKQFCLFVLVLACLSVSSVIVSAQDLAYYTRKADECDSLASKAYSSGNIVSGSHYSQMARNWRSMAAKEQNKLIDKMFDNQSQDQTYSFPPYTTPNLIISPASSPVPTATQEPETPSVVTMIFGIAIAWFIWRGISNAKPSH